MTSPEGYVSLGLIGFTDKGEYSSSEIYVANDLVHKDNKVWKCLQDNTSGITPAEGANWTIFVSGGGSGGVTSVNGKTGAVTISASDVGALPTDGTATKAVSDANGNNISNTYETLTGTRKIKKMISDMFSPDEAYAEGDYAIYNNVLYKFTGAKTAGAWDESKVQATTVADALNELNGNMQNAITTDNIGNQSVNYAETAGSANAVAWNNVSGRPSIPSLVSAVTTVNTESKEITIGASTIASFDLTYTAPSGFTAIGVVGINANTASSAITRFHLGGTGKVRIELRNMTSGSQTITISAVVLCKNNG